VTKPTRLADDPTGGFEASLIRAGRRDGPSPAARRAAALAGGALAATLVAPKATAASGTLKTIAVMSAKGFLAGALLTGAVVVAPQLLASRSSSNARAVDEAAPARGRVYSVVPAHLVEAAPVVSAAPTAPAVEASALGPGENTGTRVPSGRSVARKPRLAETGEPRPEETTTHMAVSRSGLGDEIRAFERARRAFASGDVGAAAAELDAYEREFRHGSLSLEAEVLRIEILEAGGKGAAARARAHAFLEAHPSLPESRRVRNLLSHSGADEGP